MVIYNIFEKALKFLFLSYVDDLFITENHTKKISWLHSQFHQRFEMTYLGLCSKYLGLQFEHKPNGLRLYQKDYVVSIVEEFGFANCNPSCTPLLIGIRLQKDT
jgi:hypothetical protein